jgi:hypothetical protein
VIVKENISFKRGLGTKKALRVGEFHGIDLWFKEWAPKARYEINEDLTIIVMGNLNFSHTRITELPNKLRILGNLFLDGSDIIELPEGLSVGGELDVRHTKIKTLPKSLIVGGDLDLRHSPIGGKKDFWPFYNRNQSFGEGVKVVGDIIWDKMD